MVFQNYALYPHMTCFQNIAFALKLRKILVPKTDKDGNVLRGINTRKVKELQKELKILEKNLTAISDTEVDKKAETEAKIEKTKKDIEYYSTNESDLDYYRHYTKAEIKERVEKAAKILDIEAQLDKKPGAMSGGQRQRVALGRALVRDPKVFLLDEPLSNLDAKLRGQMRVEITKLHKELGTTFIYVTHDQIEAMTMGDRIVVMKLGIIQQIDTPTNLFDYPANVFVGGFIGTPQMNFYRGEIKKNGESLVVTFENGNVYKAPIKEFKEIKSEYLDKENKKVIIGLRGDHIRISDKPTGVKAKVTFVESLGLETNIYAEYVDPMKNYLDTVNDLVIKIPARSEVKAGDILNIEFVAKHFHFFDAETEETIIVKPENVKENPEIKEEFAKKLAENDAKAQ